MARIAFLLLVVVAGLYSSNDEELTQAFVEYQLGESGETAEARSIHFNQALTLYTTIAQRATHPDLELNIGNCYFQLAEYPWAILHYEKALHLNPSNKRAQEHLAVAEKRIGVAPSPFGNLWVAFSNTQLYTGIFGCSFILFICVSWGIWQPNRMQWMGGRVFGVILLALLLIIGQREFFSPIKIVMIETSFLYRDAAEHYATVNEHPLLAGERGTLEKIAQSGEWYQIQSQNGQTGYVPKRVVRIINQ